VKPEPTAEWRLNPIAEREIQASRRFDRRRRANRWLLGLSGALVCPFACLGGCLSIGGAESSWIAALVFGSVGLLVVALARVSIDKGRQGERLDALRKEFGDVKGWLVEMSVRQGEALSGRDVGIVWFEDERLYFMGARTSFGLGRDDTQGRLASAHDVLEDRPHAVLPLQAKTLAGPVSVELVFLHTVPEHGQRLADDLEFKHALKIWFSEAMPERGQLPPLTLGPDLPSVSALRRRALAAVAIWPTLLVLALLATPLVGTFVFVGLGILVPLVALWSPVVSPRRCRRAIRDRQALDATIEG